MKIKHVINEVRLLINRIVLKIKFGKKLSLGKDFRVRKRFYCLIRGEGTIHIGNHVSFNNDCSINALGSIEIGDDVIFGEGVKIYDHNHSFRLKEGLIRCQPLNVGSVKIGNNCWIGSNVVILKGTTIGNGCVIGAGCVLNSKVPDNTVVRNKSENMFEAIF